LGVDGEVVGKVGFDYEGFLFRGDFEGSGIGVGIRGFWFEVVV
jgi:hypothetical protein